MRKLILSLSMAASLFAFDKVLPQQEVINILKSSPIYPELSAAMKKDKNIKIKGTKKDNFYIIEIDTPRGNGLIYITADKKYTILGRIIDNKTKKPVVPDFPKNAKIIKQGVLFSFGSGKKDLYLVTDPECPFCKMMEKQKKEYLAKNYKVHIILYPLSFHKNAKAMSYYILAGKTDKEKAKRLKEVLSGSNEWKNFHPTKEQIKKFNEELEKSKKAVEELQAKGTPSLYDENFKPLNWTQIGNKNESK